LEYRIIFYEKNDGEKPVEVFLDSLEDDAQSKIVRKLQLLQEFGPALREPYSKNLQDGIFELRAKSSAGAVRVLYFFCIGKEIILTNGFVKKTQKTPSGEIELAKKYRIDYLGRRGEI